MTHKLDARSRAWKHLRRTQTELNQFMNSTTLAYALIDRHRERFFKNSQDDVYPVLAPLNVPAWHNNRKGRPKYKATADEFFKHFKRNRIYLYRSVAVLWYSAFEEFLHSRLHGLREFKKGSFVPWTHVLNKLSSTPRRPVELDIVLRADFTRALRNKFVHAYGDMPIDPPNEQHRPRWVDNWIADQTESVQKFWQLEKKESETAVKSAARILDDARRIFGRRKDLGTPIDYFIVLFMFGNLDKFAGAIDVLLGPADSITGHSALHAAARGSRPK